MAAGLPFVTTPTGAEGLGPRRPGGSPRCRLADELARLALDLYRDAGLWQRVQAELLELVEERFGRDAFRGRWSRRSGSSASRRRPGLVITARAEDEERKVAGEHALSDQHFLEQRHQIESATSFGSSSLKFAAMSASRNWSSVPPKSAR